MTKSKFLWTKVNKRGEFEDGGIVTAEEYTDASRILMETYGYDSNKTDIWITDVTESMNQGKPISIMAFIRQQVLYLRKGEGTNARRRKKDCSGY